MHVLKELEVPLLPAAGGSCSPDGGQLRGAETLKRSWMRTWMEELAAGSIRLHLCLLLRRRDVLFAFGSMFSWGNYYYYLPLSFSTKSRGADELILPQTRGL